MAVGAVAAVVLEVGAVAAAVVLEVAALTSVEDLPVDTSVVDQVAD
jgi:hypothetical protein